MHANPFYQWMARGSFDPHTIGVDIVSGTLQSSADSDAVIEAAWQAHLNAGNKPWPNDLKPSRFRLVKAMGGGDSLQLILDPCASYRQFIGSLSPEFENRFGYDFVPSPLAVTVAIVTADNKILVTLRVKPTDYVHLGFHVSTGGFMNMPKGWDGDVTTLGDCMDPTREALRELREEAGINAEEVVSLVCCGVAYNPMTAHADVVYTARTTLTSAEIKTRKNDKENELFFVDRDEEDLSILLGLPHASVMIAEASLVMLGLQLQLELGDNPKRWEDQVVQSFQELALGYDDPAKRQELMVRDIDTLWEFVAERGGPARPA